MHLGNEFLTFVLFWIIDNAQNMGNRFVVVDAINNEKVIKFYERNGFRNMFRTEEEELLATGKNAESSLPTRMMFADLFNYVTN